MGGKCPPPLLGPSSVPAAKLNLVGVTCYGARELIRGLTKFGPAGFCMVAGPAVISFDFLISAPSSAVWQIGREDRQERRSTKDQGEGDF